MKKAISFALIVFFLTFLISMKTATFVSDPSACIGCHEISHQASSMFINHKAARVNCIDCHSGKGLQAYVEARTGLLNSVILKSSAAIFSQNISTSLNHSGAQAAKCDFQPFQSLKLHKVSQYLRTERAI